MNNHPRQKLGELLVQYGRSLCDDPKKLRGMLRDLCPQHTREINVLYTALEQRIPRDLLSSTQMPYELTRLRLVKRLYDDVGMAEEFAYWAVDSWALALGMIQTVPSQPLVRQVVPNSETRPVVTPLPQKRVGEVFRDRLRDGRSGPEMVWIAAGKFKMGSNEYNFEKPIHEVTIAYDFALGKYPVTFDEYDLFCTETQRKKPSDRGLIFSWGRGQRPVINVSWQDAKDYCEWLSQQTGKQYRLPSEAEWEYACRAETTTRFSFGDDDDLPYYGWFDSNSGGKTHPVGEKKPNAWGLYDLHGNVWEWCEDVWHDNYEGAPTDGSAWVTGGWQNKRLLRGGSWYDLSHNCRSASRYWYDSRNDYYGFRLCVLLSP